MLNKLEVIVLQVNVLEQPREAYQQSGQGSYAWPRASFGESQEWANVAFCLLSVFLGIDKCLERAGKQLPHHKAELP